MAPTAAKPATAPARNISASRVVGIPRAWIVTAPEVQTVSV